MLLLRALRLRGAAAPAGSCAALPRVEQPCLHGAFRAGLHRGHLGQRQPFVEHQVHAFAVLVGQLVHAVAHAFAALLLRENFERAAVVGRDGLGQLVDVLVHRVGLARAVRHQHLVARDADQPGAELRIAAKARRLAPDFIQGVGHDFLCLGGVGELPQHVGVQLAGERAVELAKGGFVGALDAAKQAQHVVVVHLRRACGRQ